MAVSRNRGLKTRSNLQNQLRRLMGMEPWSMDDFMDESFFSEPWAPAVDVKEEDGAYLVSADIPGVDPKDIELTLDQGVLTIRGERKEERKEERDNYHRIERFSGSFERRFTLPEAADAEGVEARVDKGVLVVRIPKTERAVSRRIEIKS